MASTVAAETRDFARRYFEVVQEVGRDDWVAAGDAFARAAAAHPDHPYLAYVGAQRARRAGFAAAAERVRTAEFPQIERRKAGTRRNAPVFYRIARPGAAFSLDLPYDVPASHPLRAAGESPSGNPLRRAPAPPEARSPWRRRQRNRRTAPEAAAGASGGWWQRLAAGAAALLEGLSAVAKRPRRAPSR